MTTDNYPEVLSIFPPDWDEKNRTELERKHNLPSTEYMRNRGLAEKPGDMSIEEWAVMLDWSADQGRLMRVSSGILTLPEWVAKLENPPAFLVEWAEKMSEKSDE